MSLTRTVIAGPSTNGTGLPRRVDVLGHCVTGSRAPWTFETLAGGVAAAGPGAAERPSPVWRIAPGFGVTEAGCVVVGLALALARTPGAAEAGGELIRRRRLDPRQEVLIVPAVVTGARALTQVPLAVLITTTDDASTLVAELTATTRWIVTTAETARP